MSYEVMHNLQFESHYADEIANFSNLIFYILLTCPLPLKLCCFFKLWSYYWEELETGLDRQDKKWKEGGKMDMTIGTR